MVLSSACMMEASMTDTVMSARRGPPRFSGSCSTALLMSGSGRCGARRFLGGAGLCVDLDVGAQAGLQQHGCVRVGDMQAHGNALHHLDPIAGGILGRKQRELRPGA